MRVLSLFDGISCGRLALKKANVYVEKYFCSEINPFSCLVAQTNFSDNVQLGDIRNLQLEKIGKIDLLIGGSPCQGFSYAGDRLGLEDDRSRLLLDFIKILSSLKPSYFFLENVPMSQENENYISSMIGLNPYKLNSSMFSAQNRKRLYWTNIPVKPFSTSEKLFNRYILTLNHGYVKQTVKFFKLYPTLTKVPGSKHRIVEDLEDTLKSIEEGSTRHRMNGGPTRVLSVEEAEELQCLPRDYTKAANKTERYKMIGDCWTVDLVAEIFKSLR